MRRLFWLGLGLGAGAAAAIGASRWTRRQAEQRLPGEHRSRGEGRDPRLLQTRGRVDGGGQASDGRGGVPRAFGDPGEGWAAGRLAAHGGSANSRDVPALLRGARAHAREVVLAHSRAGVRPSAHERRHEPVHPVLPRRRRAALPTGDLRPEVLPYLGHRQRRATTPATSPCSRCSGTSRSPTTSSRSPSHGGSSSSPRDSASTRIGSGSPCSRPTTSPSRSGRTSASPVTGSCGEARRTTSGTCTRRARGARARRSSSTAGAKYGPEGGPERRRGPLHGDLEPRVHAERGRRALRGHRGPPGEERRHGLEPRAGRHGAQRPRLRRRHRPLAADGRGGGAPVEQAVRRGRAGRRVAADRRGARPRHDVLDRRRRAAVQRGTRLRPSADAPAAGEPRAADRHRGPGDAGHGVGDGRDARRGVSGARGEPGVRHAGRRLGGGAILGDPAPGDGDVSLRGRRGVRRRHAVGRRRLQAARHARIPEGADRGAGGRGGTGRRPRSVRRAHGGAAPTREGIRQGRATGRGARGGGLVGWSDRVRRLRHLGVRRTRHRADRRRRHGRGRGGGAGGAAAARPHAVLRGVRRAGGGRRHDQDARVARSA